MYNQGYNNSLARSAFDGIAPFADPYVDVASQVIPTSVPAMLRHAEWLAVAGDGVMREAYNRIAAYFITKINIEGKLGEDEQRQQKDYLNKELYINSFLMEHGLSGLVYGHRYMSVFKPFTRYLVCPRCSASYRFTEFAANQRVHKFTWSDGFHGRCPACDYDGEFGDPHDEEDDSRPIILKSWNPHDMRIEYNEATDQIESFIWVVPASFRNEVRLGQNLGVLANTPWPWLEAAFTEKNVKMQPDIIRYWREPALAGLRFRGVGVPRSIVNLRRLYYTQILLRMNEVLAIGHVAPMRVISPANTAGRAPDVGDILQTSYLGDMRAQFMKIVAGHRADPNSIHYSPVPLQMQALGADARNLIPADLLSQAIEMELNAAGIPVDFFKMTLQTNVAPVGLRLMARYWAPFVDGLNADLAFIARRVQYLKRWENADYVLAEPQVVDDIERRQLEMQMAQAGLLSKTTALNQVDKDFRQETRRKLEDQRIEVEEQDKAQQENDAFSFSRQLAQAQQGSQPPQDPNQAGAQGAPAQGGQPGQPTAAQGGAPVGGGDPMSQVDQLVPQPGQKIDPETMYGQASNAAQLLLDPSVTDAARRTKLDDIRKLNPPFHGLVKQMLSELRNDARSKGQQMVLAQGGAGQQAQPPGPPQ